ncbi:2-phospho-L-lactate guanylyltransferase [Methanotorris formicicus]|uniref:2-phospho-L-lactate guanylyltransferase n=1 Tax=Methanotorris formicicus Mc-S-70 TaxID=647171 RepID=H1L0D9_9EURY|nr:2-phospho-L-lactate guanylyltransferase [Methanotorris formicicus]EHP84933.1 2-phospho-L-lactate guanylyltransferase CofC [Methanotorris formicicus Mc-S-70]
MMAVIPVSPLNSAKSRLSEFLTGEERKLLLMNMVMDVYGALEDLDVCLISKDDEILNFSKELGIIPLKEEGKGLNNAIKQAIESVEDEEVMVTPADVPLIKKYHIKEVLSKSKRNAIVISPSRGGGTNLLLLNPKDVIEPRYEGFSFLKHIDEAKKRNVEVIIYDSFLISIDINTPEDLGEVFIHGEGTNTYNYLKSLGIKILPKHSSAGRFVIKR